jgi:23S rRNA A1618 N6-methylase RlmF
MEPVGTFGWENLSASICSPPFHASGESYHCHGNACKHSNAKKKANDMLYEHMEKQRCSTITKYLFVLQE